MAITDLFSVVQSLPHADKFRLMEFLLRDIAAEEGLTLDIVQNIETEPVDSLKMLAELAQPIGPEDLARNFDRYTAKVLSDETSE